ncbi:MAG: hypothetical protein ACOCYE_12815 [Pseudomonadota bacterium]
MTLEDLRSRLQAFGYAVDEQALADIHAAWPHVEAMRRRVRRGVDRAVEPAHVFGPRAE